MSLSVSRRLLTASGNWEVGTINKSPPWLHQFYHFVMQKKKKNTEIFHLFCPMLHFSVHGPTFLLHSHRQTQCSLIFCSHSFCIHWILHQNRRLTLTLLHYLMGSRLFNSHKCSLCEVGSWKEDPNLWVWWWKLGWKRRCNVEHLLWKRHSEGSPRPSF